MHKPKKPSTALLAVSERVLEGMFQQLSNWAYSLGRSPLTMFLTVDARYNLGIEHLDASKVKSDDSYLIIEEFSRKIVGILRQGSIDADPSKLPSSRTRCVLFFAGQV
ncbi:MAG: hypothetical protein WC866_03645 [Patescibacteria group bacterium]|jgi:hypothetical protein